MNLENSPIKSLVSQEDEGGRTPFGCPRCDWIGTGGQAGEALKCPSCATRLNPLRQKGLDNLRVHYRLLSKMGHAVRLTPLERDKERERIEEFFACIGESL